MGAICASPFCYFRHRFYGGLTSNSKKIANELGLQVVGVTKTQIANGQIIEVPVALAIAAMEGAENYIQVLISESMPLVGISFLSKFSYKAIVDCK